MFRYNKSRNDAINYEIRLAQEATRALLASYRLINYNYAY